MMFGFVYLFTSFLLGFLLVVIFLPAIKGLVKLAASFLIGYFFFSWLTFLFSLLFSFSDDPLRWGILGTLGVFLAFIFLFRHISVFSPPSEESWLRWRSACHLGGVLFALVFSFWIMEKSFGYSNHHFQIASNVFDDFNVHLSIIRSFSWGKNFPPELPFFAGEPLKYHFMSDFSFAIFESLGWSPSWAVNIPSAFAFTSLLILIYSLAKRIFANAWVGLIAVLLFLFNSSLTFVKFFQQFGFSLSAPKQIWQIGKYISAGPFDKGIISIFWNLNTFLNQRHLIFTAGLFLLIVYLLLEAKKKNNLVLILSAGILVGLMPLWHGLVFLATLIVGVLLLIKPKKVVLFLFPALILSLPQFIFLSGGVSRLPLLRVGFLVAEDLSLVNLVKYWGLNLGLSLLTITAGLWIASTKQRKIFLPFFSLFLIANLFQFTPNIFHNHSLLNLWIIVFNFYSALFLVWVFKKGWQGKIFAGVLLFLLTFSGVLDLMVIKNDFIHQIPDYPQNKLITWIRDSTSTESVFLTEEKLYNPVNLAGRKVFLGASHFVWGYGFDIDPRIILTREISKSDNREKAIELFKESGADYWLTTAATQSNLTRAYEDEVYVVYQIDQD